MGFMDKAKKLAEQAQEKLDEAQKNFNQSASPQAEQPGAGRQVRRARPPDPGGDARRGDAAARRPSPPRRGARREPRRAAGRRSAGAARGSPRATPTPAPTPSSRSSSDGTVLPRQHAPRRHPHRDGHALRRGGAARRGRHRAAHAPPAGERLGRSRPRRQHGRGRHHDRRGEGPPLGARRGRVGRRAGHRRHGHLRHAPFGRAHRARARGGRRRDARRDALLRAAEPARDQGALRGGGAATDRPIVAYNIPSRTATDMPNDLLAELAADRERRGGEAGALRGHGADRGHGPARGQRRRARQGHGHGRDGRDPRGLAPRGARDAADHRRARAPARDRGRRCATSTRR